VQVGYQYDGDGLRSDLTWNVAEGMPLIAFDGARSYITGPNGMVVEQITLQQVPLYYHQDQLGSTRALSDKSGRVAVTYSYDPYGRATPSTTSVVNPIQYAGQYTDTVSGLIYMRARYYDPSSAQFLSVDPLVAITQSRYGYVGDNPVNGTDPSGLWTHGYCAQLSGAVTGGVADPSGSVAGCLVYDGEGHDGVALMSSGTEGLPSGSLFQEIVGVVKDFIANGIVSGSASVLAFNTNAASIAQLTGSYESYGLTVGIAAKGPAGVQGTGASICEKGTNHTGGLYGPGAGIGIGLPISIGGTAGFDVSVADNLPLFGGTAVDTLIPLLDAEFNQLGLPTNLGE
jgi:RHS repeat-associated protein